MAKTTEMLVYKAFRWVQHTQNPTFSVQKPSNHSSFLAPSPPKNYKNDVQGKVSENSWNFDQKPFGKCEFLNVLNPPKCFIYKHLGGFNTLWQNLKFHWKMMPKWYPKYSKTELGGYLGAQLLRFLRVLGGCQFLVVPRVSQSLSQIIAPHWKSDHPGSIFLSKCLQMLLVLLYWFSSPSPH